MQIKGLSACLRAARNAVETKNFVDADNYYNSLEAALHPITQHLADSWSARSSDTLPISHLRDRRTPNLYECQLDFDGWSLIYEVFDTDPKHTERFVVWRAFVWMRADGVEKIQPDTSSIS